MSPILNSLVPMELTAVHTQYRGDCNTTQMFYIEPFSLGHFQTTCEYHLTVVLGCIQFHSLLEVSGNPQMKQPANSPHLNSIHI